MKLGLYLPLSWVFAFAKKEFDEIRCSQRLQGKNGHQSQFLNQSENVAFCRHSQSNPLKDKKECRYRP